MPEPYPNHLVSIPNSILSLKHYFRVHDQRFLRTMVYLLILGVAITALSMAFGLIGYAREAPNQEARVAKALEEKLAAVTFKDGKATSAVDQPTVLWEDYENTPGREESPEESKKPKLRSMVVVLDTTGKVATWEQAAAFAGCPEAKRLLVFGPKQIASLDAAQGGQGSPESVPYNDEKKLAEVRKLIEESGGTLPEFTLENDVAKFKLEAGKVHLALNTPGVMVLVDTTGKNPGPAQARWMAIQDHPEIQPPEFMVLLTASGVILKPIYATVPRTVEFKGLADLGAASVARWVAAAGRQARHDIVMSGLAPNVMKMLFFLCFELLVVALICSVAGLIVSGFLHAGLPYAELLTIAVYAMTPARLVVPFALALLGITTTWAAAVPFAVGMGYTAMGTWRTARELIGTGADIAPRL